MNAQGGLPVTERARRRSRDMNSSARRLRAASILVPFALAAIAVVWATGVFGTSDSIGPDRAVALSLEPFGSCESVRDYADEHGDWGDNVLYRAVEDATPVSSAGGLAESAEAVGPSATGTNVQEIGIDEPDVAKLAGSVLFVVEGGELLTFEVGGTEPVEIGSLGVEARGASDLLLAGDRVIVIGEHYDRDEGNPLTTLTEVDVSDPAAPVALSETELEGGQVSSRLTGETARLVLSALPDYEDTGGSDDEPTWLPTATTTDLITGEITTDPLFGCEAIAYPERFAGLGLIAVVTLDLSGAMTTTDVDAVMTDGTTVYASASSLYVATAALDPPQDPGLVDRFRSALGGPEPMTVPVPPMVEDTTIHRFDTADAATTTYSSSGDVDGRIINEWSFSEHEGYLRVATTEGNSWETGGGESESSITVLAESDGRLEQVGKVGGLGPGEEIFGVRFVEDMGYVVTFEQTDPLYTVDLSSPEDPQTLGELKIAGYSAYLHPVGEGRLLGIGQAGTATGILTGAQASLFDVADAASPERLATLSLSGEDEYGTASAEWDHRAFMFSPERSLAVVPVESYGRGAFTGAVAMEVDPDGDLRELGRIEAPAGSIERTFVVGERLITLSRGEVDSYDLAALPLAG